MQAAKEKISNMASVAKERMTICRAKVEEKAEKAVARTPEEKQIAKERRKAKQAQAKMELHQAKAKHAAERLGAKQTHYQNIVPGQHHHNPPSTATNTLQEPTIGTAPLGNTATMAGTTVPTYPLGGHPPGHTYT